MYGYYTNRLNENRKAVIYARVSTEHEEQLSALENQKDWYKPILAQHPEWDVIRLTTEISRKTSSEPSFRKSSCMRAHLTGICDFCPKRRLRRSK